MSSWISSSVFLCAAGVALVVACGELKTAEPSHDGAPSDAGNESPSSTSGGATGTSGDASGSTGGSPDAATNTPAGFGPGPHGSLPSGYCCTDDSECRDRHCEDLGGGKMCLDRCRSNALCRRPPDLAWSCDNGGSSFNVGFCKPTGPFACIPAAQYELGTKMSGDCCTATGDGWAGLECAGGRCIEVGEGPFFCTQGCVQPKDCPAGFVCERLNDDYKDCVPANRPYACN